MEEPQRGIALKNYTMIGEGWEGMLERTRDNLKTGADPMDILAAEGALLFGAADQTMENLAFTLAAVAVYEAQRSPRSKGARKAAVPAKRPRKPVVDATAVDVWPDATVIIGDVTGDAA